MIAAFAGWNDAGDASTAAVRYLAEQWDAEPLATIEAEEFFDFTETRPTVAIVEGSTRRICWPDVEASFARPAESDSDVVLIVGTEPQLRWRTFCRQLTDLATTIDASTAVVLGSLLAEVPHSRPVPISGSATSAELVLRHALRRSTYEGPTGIVGVLTDAFASAGLPTVSLWATVPTYVPAAASPKATLALVERVAGLLETPVETSLLEAAAHHYESELDRLVAADEETAEYVHRLEAELDVSGGDDGVLPRAGAELHIADEVERFLRDRSNGD